MENNIESEEMYLKRAKWMWCKQLGHTLEECPQDPNIRTKFSVFDEFFRVEGLKDIIMKKSSVEVLQKTEKLIRNMVTIKDASPFKRGILLFDDYNYQYFNKVVLPSLEELVEEEEDSEESAKQSKSFHVSDEGEQEGEDQTNEQRIKEKERKEEKKLLKRLSEDEDNFTLDEIKEIHLCQQYDPFQDIEGMRNSAKLDYLNVIDRIPIKDYIKDFIPEQKIIGKALTIASSSRKDEETEVALMTKGPKFLTQENKEDAESVDSNKHFDENNLDVTNQMLKGEGTTSYGHLMKNLSKEGEISDSDEDFEDTTRQFKSIDGRKKSQTTDFFKISSGFTKGAFKNSLYSFREMQGSTVLKSNETIKTQTNITSKRQKRMLGSEMDEMIKNEVNKDEEARDKIKIVRKNTKKLNEAKNIAEEENKMIQLLD